jgi:hypothetical protein
MRTLSTCTVFPQPDDLDAAVIRICSVVRSRPSRLTSRKSTSGFGAPDLSCWENARSRENNTIWSDIWTLGRVSYIISCDGDGPPIPTDSLG